jgi:hypothetical protein
MAWTADEIEAEWLSPAGESLVRPADLVVQAVNLAEQVRGRDWLLESTRLANGARVFGFMLSLSKVVSFGCRVAAVTGTSGSEELLERLRTRDPAAESELTAIYMLRSPSVPMSLETVPPRYLCTDGRRMVPQTCPSQPKFLVERSSLPRTSASSVSPA